jgi:hypothetical protein
MDFHERLFVEMDEDVMNEVRGVIHAHSSLSADGSVDYGAMRSFFARQGLSFACVTEHAQGMSAGAISRMIIECRGSSEGGFLLIPGLELDSLSVCFLGIREGKIDTKDERALFQSLRPLSELCIISRPVDVGFDLPAWLLDACDGVEIWNLESDGFHFPRPESQRLLELMRARRPNTVGLPGLDFHHEDGFQPLAVQIDASLDAESVLAEIRAGRFRILKGDRPIDDFTPLERNLLRASLYASDAARHFKGSRGRCKYRAGRAP